jgi:hypothetical protein
MDITLGAELRRVERVVAIARTLPVWERPGLSDGTAPVSPTGARLQRSRIDIMQRAWQKDPQKFIERFIPLFLNPNPPAPEQVKR